MTRTPGTVAVVAAHAGLAVLSLVALYPVLWVVKMALHADQGFSVGWMPLPTEFSVANFLDLLGSRDASGKLLFLRQFANSVVVSAATAAVGIVLSTTAAYAFSRWSFPGREGGLQAFLVTQMFPGVVTAIPLYVLLDAVNLLDSLLGSNLVTKFF
jgi:arabinogalactan oligomer/maltooligosaccharide transport system permease protein